jgi:hypothetical protein
MNIFKLFIPKEKAQVVEELESFTVSWQYRTGWSDRVHTQHKVFIKEAHAKEFEKQLKESAKFIGCWINTDLIRN